jgi:hypothetical protein
MTGKEWAEKALLDFQKSELQKIELSDAKENGKLP